MFTYPEGGSTDFEDGASSGDEMAATLLGLGSEGSGSSGKRRRGQRQLETQPFPEQALNAARLGAAMQAAEEAGIALPAALRAASSSGSSRAGSGSSGRSSPSGSSGATADPSSSASSNSSSAGGSSKKAAAAAVHIYPFGIDGAELVSIAESLGVRNRLALAEKVQDADAVLALRAKIKTSEWL